MCVIITSTFKIIRACSHINLVDPQRQTMNRNHLPRPFTSNRASGNKTVRTFEVVVGLTWHGIWYDLAGMVRCMVWPGGNGMVYVISWRGMAWYMICPGWHGMVYGMAWWALHSMWYILMCMTWYIVWPGGHGMGKGMARRAWHCVWYGLTMHGMVYGRAWQCMA